MNLKKISSAAVVLLMVIGFNNCNRFNTLEGNYSLSPSESASNLEGDNSPTELPAPSPGPTPQIPQPTPSPQVNNGKAWPNEPAGLSMINDCAWNNLCSGWQDFYKTMSVPGGGIQPGNGPLSPPNSFKYILFPNASSGGTQLDINFTPVRRVFFGLTIKNNSDFVGYAIKKLLHKLEIQQVFTRRNHPQTNGKIERLNGTVKQEAIRPNSPQSYQEAWDILNKYNLEYNHQRLHAGINYLQTRVGLKGSLS